MATNRSKLPAPLVAGKTQLMERYPFFAHIASSMPMAEASNVKTISSDGTIVCYNREYAESMTARAAYSVLAKIVMHRVLMHPYRRGNRNKDLWDIACTIAVTPILRRSGIVGLPPGSMIDPSSIGLPQEVTAEKAYDVLVKMFPPQPQQQQGQGQGQGQGQQQGKEKGQGKGQQGEGQGEGQQQGQGQGDSKKDKKEEQKQGKGGSGQPKDQRQMDAPDSSQLESDSSEGHHSGDGRQQEEQRMETNPLNNQPMPAGSVSDALHESGRELTEYEVSQREREITEQVIAAYTLDESAKRTGIGSMDAFRKIIDDKTKPSLNYQDILAEVLRENCISEDEDFTKQHRRMVSGDIIYPGIYREPNGRIIFVIDTSSSLGADELGMIKNHIEFICNLVNPLSVMVIYCDSKINSIAEFERGEEVEIKMHGGGGTAFDPPFRHVIANDIEADVLMYFTDGYGSVSENLEPNMPVIWLSTSGSVDKPNPPKCSGKLFGEVVYVPRN